MTTQQMDDKSPGTAETTKAADPAAAQTPVETTEQRVEKKLAALRASTPAPDESARSFVDKLESEGVEVAVTPKSAPKAAPTGEPQKADDDPVDSEAFESDGLESLLESVKPTRGDKVNAAQDLQSRLEAKGMATSLAKAWANHGSRKDAEEFLANYGNPVQSEAEAGQPATETQQAPSAGASQELSLAEIQSRLNDLDGEETATAVTGVLSQIVARLQAVESATTQSVQAVKAKESSDLRAQAIQVTGEMKGMYPQLVRGETIDPAVGQTAAAMYDRGHTQGDLAASIKAACAAVYGSPVAEPRQTQINSTYEPELSAPGEVSDVGRGPIDKRQEQQILTDVIRRYANDGDKRKLMLAKARRAIDRQNAIAKK